MTSVTCRQTRSTQGFKNTGNRYTVYNYHKPEWEWDHEQKSKLDVFFGWGSCPSANESWPVTTRFHIWSKLLHFHRVCESFVNKLSHMSGNNVAAFDLLKGSRKRVLSSPLERVCVLLCVLRSLVDRPSVTVSRLASSEWAVGCRLSRCFTLAASLTFLCILACWCCRPTRISCRGNMEASSC